MGGSKDDCYKWSYPREPLTTITGFIPSFTRLQPWLNRVCWGCNCLITKGGALLVLGMVIPPNREVLYLIGM